MTAKTKLNISLKKIDDFRWEIPLEYKQGMRVPGLIYADQRMLADIEADQAFEQVANVACLPGIVNYSIAMPDIHWGYGFAIGGVAATKVEDGVVSPGGVGFDINCGVRLLRTEFALQDIQPTIEKLVAELFVRVPSGVGVKGPLRLSPKEMDEVATEGATWAVRKGFGRPEDLDFLEERGRMPGAETSHISQHARERGLPQLGTLGSGNHFLEIQAVDEIYDYEAANALGLGRLGLITVLIHTGSRGFGHQICQDFLKVMGQAAQKYQIELPDRQLACAPVRSDEGQAYLGAMRSGANFAWANRQCITHWVREAFAKVFKTSADQVPISVVYDVAHNVAKVEKHWVGERQIELCVHRKGATRAFPPGNPELPAPFRDIGQPVLIPGDMGRYSFVAVGTERAMQETWGSACHGAGRLQSRTAAKKLLKGVNMVEVLRNKGIVAKAGSREGLLEEASEAYKDVAEVVEITHQAGIARKVLKLRPLGVIKG